LEHFLESFLALCVPGVHAGIDWRCGYEPLDKGLQQIIREAEIGKRLVDKLIKLVKRLYQRGRSREQVRQLFGVLDKMLALPRVNPSRPWMIRSPTEGRTVLLTPFRYLR
jgi:hypothetical protein